MVFYLNELHHKMEGHIRQNLNISRGMGANRLVSCPGFWHIGDRILLVKVVLLI